MQHSNAYIIGFAAAICVFCSIFVAGSAVALAERQEANLLLDRQKNVLAVAGLLPEGGMTATQVQDAFQQSIRAKIVDLKTGEYVESAGGMDANTYDQRKASGDPALSREAPPNDAKVLRLPNYALIYQVVQGDQVQMLILPVEGKGLWSTLYGYLALDKDTQTVRGITFYRHGETPGLGGEIDNPKWKAQWPGKVALDEAGQVLIEVTKYGKARDPQHHVDGISGATITGRGVHHLVRFWLGPDAFGPYLQKFRQTGA